MGVSSVHCFSPRRVVRWFVYVHYVVRGAHIGQLLGRVCLLSCFALLCVLEFVCVDVAETDVGDCQKDSIVG